MNQQAWNDHLADRIAELERELTRVRNERDRQRRRALYWSTRAITAATELRNLDGRLAPAMASRFTDCRRGACETDVSTPVPTPRRLHSPSVLGGTVLPADVHFSRRRNR